MKTVIFTLLSLSAIANTAWCQIQIYPGPGVTAEEMVENITGDGIIFSDVIFQGASGARGIFTNGQSTNLGFESGIFLTTGAGYVIPGPNSSSSAGANNGGTYPCGMPPPWGYNCYDPAVLEFEFIPDSYTLQLRYVFGSEEYNEWVGSTYNDIFFLNISGPNPFGGEYLNKNIANIPGIPDTNVKINTVNNGYSLPGVVPTGPCTHCEFYKDNTGGLTLEYDGFTVVLTAWLPVVPCQTYHAEFAVMEIGDAIYDTGVFIEENSFSSSAEIEVNALLDPPGLTENLVEGHVEGDLIFRLPDTSFAPVTICFEIGGTALNGIDYEEIDPCITFDEGQDSAVIHITPYSDNVLEYDETIRLIIENTLGCSILDDTVEFLIENYIPLSNNISSETMICEGQEITLWVEVIHGYPPYSYSWEPGGLTSDSVNVSPDTTTAYIVTYSDLLGETGQDSTKVIVFQVCDFESYYFEAFLNPGLPFDIYGELLDDTVLMVFPAGTNLSGLVSSFTMDVEGCVPGVNGEPQESGVTINDFSTPVVYETLAPGGCYSKWVVIADIETGLNQDLSGSFTLSPNPTDGRFRIAIADGISAPVGIEVINLFGNIIFENKALTTKTEIDLSVFPKGMYFVRVKAGAEVFSTKLIIQ